MQTAPASMDSCGAEDGEWDVGECRLRPSAAAP